MSYLKNKSMFVEEILVIDDGGGSDITHFTDEEATELFLAWLRHKRAESARELEKAIRADAAITRRSEFEIIDGREQEGRK